MFTRKTRLLITLLIGAISTIFAGCGTKGPLYIPEQRYPQETSQPTANDSNKLDAEKTSPAQPIIKE